MERTSQNLEFSQKACTKSEISLLERTRAVHKCSVTRAVCASGGDIAAPASTPVIVDSKTSSVQNLNLQLNDSDAEVDDGVDVEADVEEEEGEGEGEAYVKVSSRMNLKKMRSGTVTGIESNSKSKYAEMGAKLNAELTKYKRELKAYNNTTKNLEEKYHKINYELNEMQQKHNRFVANHKTRHSNDTDAYSDSSLCSSSSASGTGSEFALKRKYTQVFHRKNSFVNILGPSSSQHSHDQLAFPYGRSADGGIDLAHKSRKSSSRQPADAVSSSHMKRYGKCRANNKENEPPLGKSKDLYKALKKTLSSGQKSSSALQEQSSEFKEMQATLVNFQNEQIQFRNIIQQQQSCLQDYHTRCIKAQRIMHAQQIEIDKLNSNNQQLETEISAGIDQLRMKIDMKLRDVAHLPQMMREEQTKYEKASKENTMLGERLRSLQTEASTLRLKIDELGRRKIVTINRLKAAERDLKIFKNYNTALKHEKRKLNEELQKLKIQYENMQNNSKRSIARQREQNEKQRRDLQKRVFELELKLSRSQNSTSGLIQERDSLIAELQTQLNTLVHNFEVSQKHIRVLRRHIYTLSGGGTMQGHSRGLTDPL